MTPADPPEQQLTIDPPASQWRDVLARSPVSADVASRRALGLPEGGPIIVSGHQPGFWHAGVLAKRVALEAAAGPLDAAAAWLIVDQDAGELPAIAHPVFDEGGRLQRDEYRFEPGGRFPAETPTACQPRVRAPAVPDVRFSRALEQIRSAVEGAGGDDAAMQLAEANESLLRERAAVPRTRLIRATGLNRAPAFAWWLERMNSDPGGCVEAYNAAAGAHPEAQVRPLIATPKAGRYELPLWRVKPGEPRRVVYSVQLADIDPAELAPRALLMTAMLRHGLCDLFIHGTGGGAYERVTEDWIQGWLGEPLAPVAVVTATRRLDVGVDYVSQHEVARAEWTAHAARHNPSLLGDPGAAESKTRRLQEINAAKASGDDPFPIFKDMHDALERTRARHEGHLQELDARSARLRASREDAAIAFDRTWPWPLHEDHALRGLRSEIEAAFQPGRAAGPDRPRTSS